ncbi:MAG TPA: DUF1192 domain-containing protein [Alphaproteobacteria bacterium]|nr:DUF1192 domain-containing protein [Alphaproteobacteria bacterium]
MTGRVLSSYPEPFSGKIMFFYGVFEMFDDDLPLKGTVKALKNLEPMSLAELQEYISGMEDEIARARLEIGKKSAHMNAASSLFKIKMEE